MLGFLNPRLYAGVGTAALNDITSGSSAGCNTAGFPAAKGWDAVTGFGSECGASVRCMCAPLTPAAAPDFEKLRKALA